MKKKIAAISLCIALLAVAVIGGTIAYFTDTTETVTNTFVVGDIKITLDEQKVKTDGTPDGDSRVKSNTYVMVPGRTYTKDPTVTVKANSEACYVRIKVQVTGLDALKTAINKEKNPECFNGDILLLEKFVGGWDNTKWLANGAWAFDGTDTYEFRYAAPVAKADTDTKLEPLFTTFTLPGFFTEETVKALGEANLAFAVTAEAIQADGFSDATAAWNAFPAAN